MTRFFALMILASGFLARVGKAQEGNFFPMWEGRRSQSEATLYVRDDCPQKEGHYANCLQLYDQYKKVDSKGVPDDISLFADYIAQLSERACPAKMLLYSIDKYKVLRANTQRIAKQGERCLYNSKTNRWVASLWCGNGIASPQPLSSRSADSEELLEVPPPPVAAPQPAPPPPAPPAPAPPTTQKMITPIKVFGDSAAFLIGDKLVIVRADTGVTLLEIDESQSLSVRVIQSKKKNNLLPLVGAFVVGGGVGALLRGGGDVCGPVNPPNHLADFLKTKSFFIKPSRGGATIGIMQSLSPLRE